MKTSHIIKLLAGITIATTLSACGGGGGGGGGGGSDDGKWAEHPGSGDPSTKSDDKDQLLKGRQLELLKDGTTKYTFYFQEDGVFIQDNEAALFEARTTEKRPYTYTVTDNKSAQLDISYTPVKWEGQDGKVVEADRMKIQFLFSDAENATCPQMEVNGTPLNGVTARFRLLTGK